MICYSQTLDLKFLLEGAGLFAEMRINRDLGILSNGQILTMNVVQKEFIQTMIHEDHVEKDVVLTGPVGSGKTLLGLEAINIKKSHYKKIYEINAKDCQSKLRVIVLIGGSSKGSQLKHQLEKMYSSVKDCSLEIQTEVVPKSQDLTRIFKANQNYKSYSHTIIMLDEIGRSQMCKVNLEEDQNVDYIYSLYYAYLTSVQPNFQTFKITDATVECNLAQRQRSSQQILDLADYLLIHCQDPQLIRRYNSPISFSSDIPLWIIFDNPNLFFDHFKDKFESNSNDVMLIWDYYDKPSNLQDIEEFCREKRWRCTLSGNVRGSESSVTILYNVHSFLYEHLTRAKTQLIIVTIDGKLRYFL